MSRENANTPDRSDFLPLTAADMRKRGWDRPDFVYVTGDAYVDHPSFGTSETAAAGTTDTPDAAAAGAADTAGITDPAQSPPDAPDTPARSTT